MNIIEHTQLKKTQVKLGQFYRDKEGETFLIARSGCDHYRIISLETGDRWDDGTYSLEDVSDKIKKHDFVLVTKPFTITPNI